VAEASGSFRVLKAFTYGTFNSGRCESSPLSAVFVSFLSVEGRCPILRSWWSKASTHLKSVDFHPLDYDLEERLCP
jgi:hypothetical protein